MFMGMLRGVVCGIVSFAGMMFRFWVESFSPLF